MAIGLEGITAVHERAAALAPESPGGLLGGFARLIEDARATATAAETEAAKTIGGKGDLVRTATAVTAAELAIETLASVRERALAAYNDIMRMPM